MIILQKKNKIIIIILVILSLIGILVASHYIEEQIFYDTIKKVSDLENKSDTENMALAEKAYPSTEEIKESCVNTINTSSEEIAILQDLKGKVFNESYREYIDIEINRLTCENKTNTIMLDESNVYEDYQNGKIGSSRTLSLINDNKEEMDSYVEKVKEYKVESDTFLSRHTDMKERFDKLGIDEDFMFNQIQEVNVESIT